MCILYLICFLQYEGFEDRHRGTTQAWQWCSTATVSSGPQMHTFVSNKYLSKDSWNWKKLSHGPSRSLSLTATESGMWHVWECIFGLHLSMAMSIVSCIIRSFICCYYSLLCIIVHANLHPTWTWVHSATHCRWLFFFSLELIPSINFFHLCSFEEWCWLYDSDCILLTIEILLLM